MNFKGFLELFFSSKNSPLVPLRIGSKNEVHQKLISIVEMKFKGCKIILEVKTVDDETNKTQF